MLCQWHADREEDSLSKHHSPITTFHSQKLSKKTSVMPSSRGLLGLLDAESYLSLYGVCDVKPVSNLFREVNVKISNTDFQCLFLET